MCFLVAPWGGCSIVSLELLTPPALFYVSSLIAGCLCWTIGYVFPIPVQWICISINWRLRCFHYCSWFSFFCFSVICGSIADTRCIFLYGFSECGWFLHREFRPLWHYVFSLVSPNNTHSHSHRGSAIKNRVWNTKFTGTNPDLVLTHEITRKTEGSRQNIFSALEPNHSHKYIDNKSLQQTIQMWQVSQMQLAWHSCEKNLVILYWLTVFHISSMFCSNLMHLLAFFTERTKGQVGSGKVNARRIKEWSWEEV